MKISIRGREEIIDSEKEAVSIFFYKNERDFILKMFENDDPIICCGPKGMTEKELHKVAFPLLPPPENTESEGVSPMPTIQPASALPRAIKRLKDAQ